MTVRLNYDRVLKSFQVKNAMKIRYEEECNNIFALVESPLDQNKVEL